jgi:hypothetical protein
MVSDHWEDIMQSWYPNYPIPATPVVTQGHFAGAPRPLYHVGAAPESVTRRARRPLDIQEQRHGVPTPAYAVGAPPAGGDYSFTRRPGFNNKDY